MYLINFGDLMLKQVLHFCLDQHLFKKGDRLLLACSGGPDSLSMLHIFQRLCKDYQLNIFVTHVEHGIRGAVSLADATFVQNFCQKNNISFYLIRVNAPQYAKSHKLSLETAARKLRYEALQNAADKFSCSKIAIAQHRGDQAETLLMHLLRGAGLDGLSGILPKSENLIRPLLTVSRAQIEAYCQYYNLEPRHDSTNNDITYTRNSIRWQLLKQLQQYNPNIEETLCQTARLLACDNDFLTNYTANQLKKLTIKASTDRYEIDIDKFLDLHIAIKQRLLRLTIIYLLGSVADFSSKHIASIISLAQKKHTGKTINLPHLLQVSIEYSKLVLTVSTPLYCNPKISVLNLPGDTEAAYGFTIRAEKTELTKANDTNTVCYIDADKLIGKLRIRHRKYGDIFSPKGTDGHKKLKDLFIDKKIPRQERNIIPILFDDAGIVWVAGIQQDNHCVPDIKSKNIFKLSLLKSHTDNSFSLSTP